MSRARRERTKRNAILLKQNTVVGTVGLSANANGPRLGMRQASQPTVAALYDRRFLSKHEPALAERRYRNKREAGRGMWRRTPKGQFVNCPYKPTGDKAPLGS